MSKVGTLFVGALMAASLSLATVAQAQEVTICLDGSVANGDCIPISATAEESQSNGGAVSGETGTSGSDGAAN